MAGLKNLRKQRRIQVIAIAAAALVLSTALIGYAMRDGINFFFSPTQIAENPPAPTQVIRIGGLVEAGSLQRGQGETISFRVTDNQHAIAVSYTGILPDLFEEGQGVVAQGRYANGGFEAIEILAKHDESYMPKEVIEALKDQGVYVAPDAAQNGAAATN